MATKEETETTITWSLADERATVYSLMPKIWRRCEAVGGIETDLDRGLRNGKKDARTFLVDPNFIAIRRPRKIRVSPERQLLLATRMREASRRRRGAGIGTGETALQDRDTPEATPSVRSD